MFEDGQPIGRIRYASERTPGFWVWHAWANSGLPAFRHRQRFTRRISSLGDFDAISGQSAFQQIESSIELIAVVGILLMDERLVPTRL